MHATTFLLLVAGLAPAALAQSQRFVSPAGLDLAEGNSSNAYPWTDATPRRYLQIHSDVPRTSMVLQKIAWRRDGNVTPVAGTRVVDLQLRLGHTVEYDAASWVFANNWIVPPQVVVPRQVWNFGPATTAGTPAPFELALPLVTPFVYIGVYALGWEATVWSSTAVGAFAAGLDAASVPTFQPTNAPTTGLGCVVAGQVFTTSLNPTLVDAGGVGVLGVYIERAPAGQPALLALGTSNPAWQVQGFCSSLLTDLALVVPIGSTDATGFLGATAGGNKYPGAGGVVMFPNTIPGARIYLQAHVLDPGSSSAVLVANTDGHYVTVPSANPGGIRVTRIFNSDGGTTAANAFCAGSGFVGYGLVTEFTY